MASPVAAAVMSQPASPFAFLWGDNGQMLTPEQADAKTKVAQAIIANAQTPRNVGEGLGAVGKALIASKYLGSANAAITAGRTQATQVLQAVLADPSKAGEFIANDPYATDGQKTVAQAILQQQMMLTNPDMIAQRANLASETQKNLAEAGMMQGGGTAVGSPIQDANGNWYIPTQYGGQLRPLSAPGQGVPSGASPAALPQDTTTPVPLAPVQGGVPGATPVAAPVGGAAPAAASPAGTPQFLTPAQQAEAKAQGEKTGQNLAELPRQMVTAKNALDQLDQSDQLVGTFIDQAMKEANGLSTGWVGKLSEQLPGSPAYKLARTLDTVRANIGFDKLNAMRAASPSGGALGQVSNFEEQLLQSVQGSLDQGQDPATVIANLQRIKGFIAGNSQQRKAAFNADFAGVKPLSGDPSFNKPSGSAQPIPVKDAASYAAVPSGAKYVDPVGNVRVKQ